MKRVLPVIVLVLGFASAMVSRVGATWVPVGDGQGVNVTLLESSPERIALELTLGGFDRTDLMIDGQMWSQVRLPGEGTHLEAALPELPLVARSVIIPDDRLMVLSVVSSDYVDLENYDVAPSKGTLPRTINPADVPYTFGGFYEGDSWFPVEAAFAREAYILRDLRGQTVVVSPIQYQRSTRTLRVYTRLEIELVDAGPGGANVFVRDEPLDRVDAAFREIYANHFLNYSNARYQPVGEVGKMLVIAYDDFASTVQPLVDWKNQMGLPTTLVLKSQVGTSSNQFKTYIQNYYDNSTGPNLTYVLLVGDAAQIPSPVVSGGSSDPTYAKVAGSDDYPDIFVGRFSAENVSQVQTQVTRTINYEKDPLLVGADWYPKGIGIASNQGPGDDGELDFEHIDVIRGLLMNYGYNEVDQVYDPFANSGMVSTALNAGRSILNYCGHGSATSWGTSGFSNTHVNNLVNDHMLPFMISVACQNGRYDGLTCFAEAWLRATHNGNPTGAIGFYGSSIDQYWNEPMCAQDEVNRLLVTNSCRTYAGLCYNGSCQMMDEYGGTGITMYLTWHVFGDPSLRVRTAAPLALNVTHAATLPSEATTLDVDVLDQAGALCALSYQGALLGSALTDGSGHATIQIEGPVGESQTLDLTVTAYNAVPYLGTVTTEEAILPILVLDPTSFELTLPPEGTQVEMLHVSNQGPEGSTLDFTIRVSSLQGTWLSVTPNGGILAAGETMDIEVRVDAAGLVDGDYDADLTVTYNPQQTATVPVMLHVVSAPSDAREGSTLPTVVMIEGARPNPSTRETVVGFGLPTAQSARLTIHDASGRVVRSLASGTRSAGYHEIVWNGRDDLGRTVPAGLYLARLETSEKSMTTRLLRVR